MTAPATTVAVLGTGTMGAPMARNLVRAGSDVRVWNRTVAKAAVLAAKGARAACTPADAAADAELALHAANQHEVHLPLTDALFPRWRAVIANNHGGDDVASAVTAAVNAIGVR